MQNKPNLILIFTDQQRWDTLGAYGNGVIQTPHLDRMAAEGAVFENAVTPCPVCVPARACTITGYPAGRLGILNNSCDTEDRRDTLATTLNDAGYHTQGIGKMHFTPTGETYGMDHLILSEEMRPVRFAPDAEAAFFDDYDQFLIENGMWGWEKPPEIGYNEIKPVINGLPKEFHVTQWCGDRTVAWLKEDRPKDKPFFVWTSFVKPHPSFDCPSHLLDLYDPADMPAPWLSPDDGTEKNPYYAHNRRRQEFDLYSEEAARRAKAFYYANITFIDEQIGRLFATLHEEGLADNTLVVFTSDHGEMLGDHGQWHKLIGYEGSLHVPMLAWWPGRIRPGARVDDVVSLLDIFPTLATAARAEAGNERYGEDLLGFLDGETHRELSFSECLTSPHYLLHVRHKDWKYMYYQEGGFEELYDLQNDPHELHDLADDAGYQTRKRELRDAAIAWLRQYSSPEPALDDSGGLRAVPYQTERPRLDQNPRPYSRMPWDSRVPPAALPEEQRSWWWKEVGGDWSQMIEYARAARRGRK